MSFFYNKSYISRFGSNHFFASRRQLILKNNINYDGTCLYEETSLHYKDKEKKEVVLSRLFFKVIKLCLQTKSGSKKTARLLYKSFFKHYFLNNFFSLLCNCVYKDFENENENVTHKSIKIFDFFKKKPLKLKKNKQFFGSSKQKSFFYNKINIVLNKQKKSNKNFFFLTNFYLKRIDSLDHNFCLPSVPFPFPNEATFPSWDSGSEATTTPLLPSPCFSFPPPSEARGGDEATGVVVASLPLSQARDPLGRRSKGTVASSSPPVVASQGKEKQGKGKGKGNGWKKKSEYKVISNNFFLFHYFSKLLSAELFLLKNFIPINNTSFNNQRKWFLQANKKFYKIQNVLFFLKKKNYINLFEIDFKKQTILFRNFYKGKEESFWCGEKHYHYKELKFISLQKFISKLQINKETQDQTPIKVNLFNLNHINNLPSLYLFLKKAKLFFFKSYFFSAHSLPFENRQIHRFIYFCLFSKRAENPFLTQTNLPLLIKKISLEKSYNLDIFLFSFLYMWAKNQHENHSNSWVFNKYWVFLQPLAYFFYNIINIGITSQNIYLKKKSYILQDMICKELISKSEKNTNYLRKENIFFYKTNNFSTCALPEIRNTSFVFSGKKVFRCKLNKVFTINLTKSSLNLKKVDDDFFNELNKNLKKKRILKTWYLENYKATFIFKIDVNREQKKFKFYFTKLKLFKNIKLNSLKTCLTCTKTFNQELEKDFYKKIFVSKDFKNLKYKHIKFYLTKRDFYLNKPFKNSYPNLFLPFPSGSLARQGTNP